METDSNQINKGVKQSKRSNKNKTKIVNNSNIQPTISNSSVNNEMEISKNMESCSKPVDPIPIIDQKQDHER
jgi:hypothetical protein